MKMVCRSLLVFVGAVVHSMYGQGFYTTYQIDGGSYIQTDAIGYPGSGSCGSLSLWNAFNGNYVSAWAPVDLMSGSYGSDGVSYAWNYGYSFQYLSPYGYCVASSVAWYDLLGFAVTTARNAAVYSDMTGWCAQSTICTNTASPRCPISKVYVGGANVACLTVFGSSWREYLVVILDGTCEPTPFVIDATGPGYCTPN